MCRRVECRECGRPTYAGCGAHVEQVLAAVPASERCHCREERRQEARLPASGSVWLRKLLGR